MTETETKTPCVRETPQCRRIKIILRPQAAPQRATLAAASAVPLHDDSLAKLVQSAEEIAKEQKRVTEIRRIEAEAARARFAAD